MTDEADEWRDHTIDASGETTSQGIDRRVCYPIPPPDDQRVAVAWGVLRNLTDAEQRLNGFVARMERLESALRELIAVCRHRDVGLGGAQQKNVDQAEAALADDTANKEPR